MIQLLMAAGLGLVFSIFGTPLLIKVLARHGYGQYIRDDGPTSHQTKRGTPTMGGVAILLSVVAAYLVTHLISVILWPANGGITLSGVLALALMLGMGLVGFLDDYKKISQKQNLGLTPAGKMVLQGAIGSAFAVLVLFFPDEAGSTPASTAISWTRDTGIDLAFAGPVVGLLLFVVWVNLIATGTTNAVNLTDGLDGLATGASILVFSGYMLITLWQAGHLCENVAQAACYEVRDPMDLSLVASALVGSLIGFLWWNTSPAKIFMGDTGSLGLGGALAAFAVLSRTELLLVLIAGLFVVITMSVILQVGYFKLSHGKRIFKMAPLQHHFELKGWQEVTIVVRFWVIAGLFVAAALGMFYGDWLLFNGGAFPGTEVLH